MVEKKKRPAKKSTKGKSEATRGKKHPEQKKAEQEEKRTLQERKEPATKSPSRKTKDKGPFPIVGIGASAGGLEALEAFFDALPPDSGLAFVVISHTDPKHASMLPELIKRRSKIPVEVVRNDLAPKPDTIYLPPSNRDLVLEKRKFHLKERPVKPEIHMPVDLFFKHLAEDMGDLSACVILSGTGTDGTQGLRLIKEKAGLAVAQDPNSARHGGMPRSAIDTGLVDYVLAPSEMPKRLAEYFQHPAAIHYETKERKATDPLKRILNFLASRTRHDFSFYKENTLVRRIERRMTVTRSHKALEYLKLLQQDPREVRALFQDLLIGVTNFFRDPEAFAFLKKQVLPDLISQREDGTFRVWIPGCATGEEAYSIAILVQEYLEENEIPRQFQIFGTDIDPHAIEKARQGNYLQNIASDVSPERLKRFFTKEDSFYRVKSDIREQVVFAEQNVLADPPFSKLDLLVCRNLLIYLKQSAQNRLIPLFHYSLRDGGILFIGSSESLGRHHNYFEEVSKQHSIYRKKNHLIHPEVQFPMASRKLERPGVEPEPAPDKEPTRPELSLGQAVEKVLIEEHTPPCVVVNKTGEIIHFHGRTGKYLEPASGPPTLQIADMAREGLRFVLLSALRRVNEENREVIERGVQVKTNKEFHWIDLVVKHLSEPPLKDCRMVIFEESPQPDEAKNKPESQQGEEDYAERTAELEQELMRLRQDYRSAVEELQTSNEELQSSNEELHSSNEELQSTNEELESSREELHSLNEELNTVNSELNSKVAELREAYNAINSVLNSTRIAIVFLDNELRLARFTPEAEKLLNVIDSDLGRPMDHITYNLEYENLVERTRQVLKNLSSIDEEVRTEDGHWYGMRIMVHRPKDHVIEGVVLTFINIDAQKKAQQEIEEMSRREVSAAKRFAESIVDTVRESLMVLDSEMRVLTANRSFYETFGERAHETEGKSIFELGDGQWDTPNLRTLLREIIEKDKTLQDFLLEHRFPKVGFKRMLLNARMLREEDKEGKQILLAMEDVTNNPGFSGEEKK